MLHSGLFWKIFGACVVLVVLTSVVAGWAASLRLAEEAQSATKSQLEGQVGLLCQLVEPHLADAPLPAFQARVRALGDLTGSRVTIVGADGVVLADSSKDPAVMDNHGERVEIIESRTQPYGHATRHSDTLGMSMMYVARRIPLDGGMRAHVRAALPVMQLEGHQRQLRNMVLRAALISILVGLLLAFFIARRLARPLHEMAAAALAISEGDFERRVPANSSDELGALGRTFNTMAKRLHAEVGTINRERAELRAMLGGMVEGVIAVDAQERIVLMNDAAGSLFGIEPEQTRGKRIWEVLRWSKVPATVADAVKAGKTVATEVSLTEEGRQRVIRLYASPQAGGDGTNRGVVLVLEDITDRRRLESVRRDFIANASHELKTPVAAIRGLIETIIEDPDMTLLTRQGFLERVLRQSDRLGEVVEEMLSLSRLESGTRGPNSEPFDVRASIREAVNDAAPLAAQCGVGVTANVGDVPIMIRGQAGAVRRIVSNLLDNAIKYSKPESRVVVRLHRVGESVELSVTDRGQGIPLDKQARVFERFYRVDEGRARAVGGTGLGLSIVKHLVQSMDGEVKIDSQPGVGSTFRVTWPAA